MKQNNETDVAVEKAKWEHWSVCEKCKHEQPMNKMWDKAFREGYEQAQADNKDGEDLAYENGKLDGGLAKAKEIFKDMEKYLVKPVISSRYSEFSRKYEELKEKHCGVNKDD